MEQKQNEETHTLMEESSKDRYDWGTPQRKALREVCRRQTPTGRRLSAADLTRCVIFNYSLMGYRLCQLSTYQGPNT